MTSRIPFLAVALLATAFLNGCSTPKSLYYYGQYNSAVYSYFKADEVSIDEQISLLESIIQTAAAKNKAVAPGIHAHLGMLYFEAGNPGLGTQHFEQEQRLFPESKQYIDFLLKSVKDA